MCKAVSTFSVNNNDPPGVPRVSIQSAKWPDWMQLLSPPLSSLPEIQQAFFMKTPRPNFLIISCGIAPGSVRG